MFHLKNMLHFTSSLYPGPSLITVRCTIVLCMCIVKKALAIHLNSELHKFNIYICNVLGSQMQNVQMKNVFLYCTQIFSSSRMPHVYTVATLCTLYSVYKCVVQNAAYMYYMNLMYSKSECIVKNAAFLYCMNPLSTVYNVHCIVQYCVQCS